MVYFKTKNPNLGKLWRVLQLKLLVYFMSTWYILLPLDIFYGRLVYFIVIWLHFFLFWYVVARIIWQPCRKRRFLWPQIGVVTFKRRRKRLPRANSSKNLSPLDPCCRSCRVTFKPNCRLH
jgi:hypothetical protein